MPPRTFSRRVRLAPGPVLTAAARWAEVVHYPRELTDEVARDVAEAHVLEHGGDAESTREAFVAAARAQVARFGAPADGG